MLYLAFSPIGEKLITVSWNKTILFASILLFFKFLTWVYVLRGQAISVLFTLHARIHRGNYNIEGAQQILIGSINTCSYCSKSHWSNDQNSSFSEYKMPITLPISPVVHTDLEKYNTFNILIVMSPWSNFLLAIVVLDLDTKKPKIPVFMQHKVYWSLTKTLAQKQQCSNNTAEVSWLPGMVSDALPTLGECVIRDRRLSGEGQSPYRKLTSSLVVSAFIWFRHMRSSNEDTRLLLSLQLQLNLINTGYSVLEKYQEWGTGAKFSTSSSIRFWFILD